MKKANFDAYLDAQLKDKDFAERFSRAGEACFNMLSRGKTNCLTLCVK